jgi:hypothetical protein
MPGKRGTIPRQGEEADLPGGCRECILDREDSR